MATKDPLIGLTVTINPDAKPAKGGGKHPYAGQQAQVIGKPPGGRSYWLQCGAAQVSVPLADFTVVGTDAAQAAPADSTLSLSELVRSKTNRQIVEDEALLEMAATMKVYGVLQPLLVRRLPAERLQDTFEDEATKHATHEIIAGERRFMAARIAGLRRVPVHIVAADNSNAVVMQLIENLHRADLNPLDEAHGIQLLVDAHSMTRAAVADALRKSLSHVMESLRLLKICPEAIAALKAGTLNRSVALLVAQRPTPALQVEFTRKVLTGGPDGGPLSYRSAKDLAQRNYMTDLTQAPFALDNAQLLPQVGACTQCPKRTGANPQLWDKAAAGEALQAKGAAGKADKKAPTRTKEELEDEYQQRWRSAAVRATIEGLRVDAEPESLDHLPEQAAYRVILTLARETDDSALRAIFQLPAHFDDDALEAAVRSAAQGAPRLQNMVLLMLAAAFDWGRLYNRPSDEALHLESVAPIAKVDIGAIKREVQQAMNAEAVERAVEADAEAAAPADKAKPTIKSKGKAKGAVDGTGKASQAEVMAGIAQAMQQVEAPPSFTKGQVATLKTDVKNEHGKLVPCKGQKASILEVQGRKLRVSVPDSSWPFPLSLTVDYIDLEAADANS